VPTCRTFGHARDPRGSNPAAGGAAPLLRGRFAVTTIPCAQRIWNRCEELARHSEQPDGLTRVFLSKEQRSAGELVMSWMREAGMSVGTDAIGNVVGRYEGVQPGLPCLMLGSHLDSVRDAGKYDGMLGVVTPIECVRALFARGLRLPFAIEIVGFADEEGVRFGATLLGSRAIAGTFRQESLDALDRDGVSMREALRRYGLDPANIAGAARRRDEILAYAELHIEQGPVLEAERLPVGVVSAINGFTRMMVTLTGCAGHAGTVPMNLRRDALTAAAECVLAIERRCRREAELVGTVGRIEALPGAINVIPGEARFSIDIRAPRDDQRIRAVDDVTEEIERLCAARGIGVVVQRVQDNGVAACAPWLIRQMEQAIAAEGIALRRLPSGAGHDGLAIIELADICMLFVRCKGGISHHPAEAISVEDAGMGARILSRFIENFSPVRQTVHAADHA
jgi:allantoate deiminase